MYAPRKILCPSERRNDAQDPGEHIRAAVYTLMYKGRIVLKEVTDKAAFECETNERETK